jgi:hypothetical protein
MVKRKLSSVSRTVPNGSSVKHCQYCNKPIVLSGLKNHERFCSKNPAAEQNRKRFGRQIAAAVKAKQVSSGVGSGGQGVSIRIKIDRTLANRIAEKLIGAEIELIG